MTLWQFSAREVKSRPGRAALTLISIVIGVAAVVSVAMSTITTRRAYKEMYQTLTGRAAVEIVSEVGQGFDDKIMDELSARKDVRAVVPIAQRVVIVFHDKVRRLPNGEQKKETERMKVNAMGIDPARDKDARDYKLVSGQFFEGTKGVLLEESFARLLGIGVGDEIRALTGGKITPEKLKVVGILAPEGAASLRQGVMFLHLKNAQKLFKMGNKVDAIHLVPADLAHSEELLASVEKTLPPGLLARKPAARSQLTEETLDAPQQGLELASALSLVVAAIIILNTFLINVSERRRQLAILRAIGATRGQIRRLLLAEGLLLGFVGTAIGMCVGLAGAFYLTRVMEQIFQIKLPSMQISPLPFVLGAILGIGISLLATIIPAWLASRVSPLEGMRTVTREDVEGVSGLVTICGLVLLAIAGALVVAFIKGLFLKTVPMIAVVLALVGCALVYPAVLDPLSKFISKLLSPILRTEGELARRQLMRRRLRTTLTTVVLFVAIAAGIGLGTTIVNNTDDVRGWFDRTVIGDFFVRAMNPDMASGVSVNVPEELGDEIRKIPGVYEVNSARIVSISIGDRGAILVARDFQKTGTLPLDLRDGDPAEVRKQLAEGEIVIGTVLAHRMKLKRGDSVELATRDGGKKKFRIAGAANEYLVGGLAIYMDRSVAKKELGVEGVDGFAVKVNRKDLMRVGVTLAELSEKHGLLLQSFADMRKVVDDKVNGIVGGLWVLLALGFVVAAFGIANTLTMNVLEQTRELGLLRIVAMTRRQVRKMILSQAVIMGFIGLAPGAIVGAGIAYLVSRGGEGEFGRSIALQLHPLMFFGAFAAAYTIVVLAAWFPAQRAAKMQLTEALRYE